MVRPSSGVPWFELALLDLTSSSISPLMDTRLSYPYSWVRFDPVTSHVVVGNRGSSPGSLATLEFDAATGTLGAVHQLFDAGSNCQDLMLSTDGVHIAFACVAGNGSGYTSYDYSSADLSSRSEWDTGSYPRSAAFSPDDSVLAALTGALRFSRVDSHLATGSAVRLPDCPWSRSNCVRWMRDGSGVVALTGCAAHNGTTRVLYQPI